ncbi:MAG: BACON domain-containing protein [Saprospiraceae bacterium]
MKHLIVLIILYFFCINSLASKNVLPSSILYTVPGNVLKENILKDNCDKLPILDVYPTALTVSQAGTSQPTFTISSNINWNIVSNMSWLTVNKSNGNGNATITVNASANPLLIPRIAQLTISGQNVSSKVVVITQNGIPPSLSVSPTYLGIAAQLNSTTSFNITSNISWSLFSNQNWLQPSSQSGSGNALITLTAQKNAAINTRQATITCSASGVPDRTISVTQEAATPTLSANPQVLSIASFANSQQSFSVLSNTSWSTASNQSWLKINTTTGFGDATVIITADLNPGIIQRTAQIVVSSNGLPDETVVVTQDASTPFFEAVPNDLTISTAANNNRQIFISSNTDWSVMSNQTWLDLSKLNGRGSGSIVLLAQENATTQARNAILTFTPIGSGVKTISITQNPGDAVLTVTPENLGIAAQQGSIASFNINSNTSWDISIEENWLVADTYKGAGNSFILLTAQVNPATTVRTTNIKVTAVGLPDKMILVTQSASGIQLSLSPTSITLPSPASSTGFIDVQSNTPWSLRADQNWLSLNKTNGTGNEKVMLTAQENSAAKSRIANIILTGSGSGNHYATVIQEAAPVALAVQPKNILLKAAAGDKKKILVQSNSDWTAESSESWLSINKYTGLGNDSIVVTSAENTKNSSRMATVTISSKGIDNQIVLITQEAAEVYLNATPENVRLSALANSSQFVSVNSNTRWSISSSETWLSIDKSGGLENANILITALANPYAVERTAIVSLSAAGIADKLIFVTQDAAPGNVRISPDSLLIGALDQSTAVVDIFSNANWKLNSNQIWLRANIGSGFGNSSVTLTAAGNPASSRRYTTLTVNVVGISEKTIYIAQEASPVFLSASPLRIKIAAAAGSSDTLQILTNTAWNLIIDQKWLTVNNISGSSSSTLTITADANTGPSTRTSLVTIQGVGAAPVFIIVEQYSNTSKTLDYADDYSFYPNPTLDKLYIKDVNNLLYGSSASILDVSGKVIFNTLLQNNQSEIDVSGLQSGFYFLQIRNPGSQTIEFKKFIKM